MCYCTNTLPELIELVVCNVAILATYLFAHVSEVKHAVHRTSEQVALIVLEVLNGSLEIAAYPAAFDLLIKASALLGVVVGIHHHVPRGIITNTTDELHFLSGITECRL